MSGELRVTVCRNYWPLNIEKVEEKYNAKYIGDFALKLKNGGWSEEPAAVFYVEEPDISKGHSHYFGLVFQHNPYQPNDYDMFITKGDSAFENGLTGVVADNGEVIVSCFTHDFKYSEDGSVFTDGGMQYLRTNSLNTVKLKIVKDKFEIE